MNEALSGNYTHFLNRKHTDLHFKNQNNADVTWCFFRSFALMTLCLLAVFCGIKSSVADRPLFRSTYLFRGAINSVRI